MARLTSPTNKLRKDKRSSYADALGAGSGTILLMFAENMPDTYWFKTYVMLAMPSLAVSFSKIIDLVLSQCKSFFEMLSNIQSERIISKKLKLLKKDPSAPRAGVKQLEEAYMSVKIKRIEDMINRLGKTRND